MLVKTIVFTGKAEETALTMQEVEKAFFLPKPSPLGEEELYYLYRVLDLMEKDPLLPQFLHTITYTYAMKMLQGKDVAINWINEMQKISMENDH